MLQTEMGERDPQSALSQPAAESVGPHDWELAAVCSEEQLTGSTAQQNRNAIREERRGSRSLVLGGAERISRRLDESLVAGGAYGSVEGQRPAGMCSSSPKYAPHLPRPLILLPAPSSPTSHGRPCP